MTMQFQAMPGSECSALENRIDFSDEQNWAILENEKDQQSAGRVT